MTDLSTTYLGLKLRSPLLASAGPLTGKVETCKGLVDSGASALVLPSLFEEEILHEEQQFNAAMEAGAEVFAEATDYFPDEVWAEYETPSDRYLAHIEAIRGAVDVPVIASINAVRPGSWIDMATQMENAGASALELNLYHVATDPARSGADVEQTDINLVQKVCGAVNIPVAVKLSPYYSSVANMGRRFVEAGASGLVLFNRFYQPDLDVNSREVMPKLQLSERWELRLPMRWIAVMRPAIPHASLAATSGIQTGEDVAKALLVGADVAMMTGALLHYGPQHLRKVEEEFQAWADEHEYDSVEQLRGSVSLATTENPEAFERGNYYKILHSLNDGAAM